jgi:hypothetical protein
MTGYYPDDATALEISRDLLSGPVEPEEIRRAEGLLERVKAAPERQRSCLDAAAAYLPEGFRFEGPLYLTWGYDIGVSMNGTASLNLAHPRFAADLDELWHYCVHEMHHAGFTSYQPFPVAVPEIATAGQMFRFIRYATMLEGMAVHAALGPRRRAGALDADPDYVALRDEERMIAYERAYREIYQHFEEGGDRPLADEDWELVERLSDGDRLWYRVGARMAAVIERHFGLARLRELPRTGSAAFFAAHQRAAGHAPELPAPEIRRQGGTRPDWRRRPVPHHRFVVSGPPDGAGGRSNARRPSLRSGCRGGASGSARAWR